MAWNAPDRHAAHLLAPSWVGFEGAAQAVLTVMISYRHGLGRL